MKFKNLHIPSPGCVMLKPKQKLANNGEETVLCVCEPYHTDIKKLIGLTIKGDTHCRKVGVAKPMPNTYEQSRAGRGRWYSWDKQDKIVY